MADLEERLRDIWHEFFDGEDPDTHESEPAHPDFTKVDYGGVNVWAEDENGNVLVEIAAHPAKTPLQGQMRLVGEAINALLPAADHISAQTQTISDLTRALEEIADGATWENGASTADENLKRHAFESLKLARAALSSARKEEK